LVYFGTIVSSYLADHSLEHTLDKGSLEWQYPSLCR